MTRSSPQLADAITEFPALARRFEAVLFDWDGTAVAARGIDTSHLRRLVEEASSHGLELAVVSGTHVGNVDGQLAARPAGPGGLILALNRGSEVFSVDQHGPQLAFRRTATAEERRRALTRRAAERRAVGGAGTAGANRV